MINIILPYENAKTHTEIWGISEKEICFEKDFFESTRCTLAFSGIELKNHLKKIILDEEISYDCCANDGFNIILEVQDEKCDMDDYSLIPLENGIKIVGKGRAGVLYGAYEFLKIQGFRWLTPSDIGNVVPLPKAKLENISKRMDFSPHMNEGRGFDLENYCIENEYIWLWMARNRLNFGVFCPRYNALQKKLCIKFKIGGHIFEKMLSPTRVTQSGKTLWEEHKDWYGKRKDDIEVTKENCLHTQFCVTNDELTKFLSDELIYLLKHEWSVANRVDIWGFDTWGNVCDCEKCQKLGNSTDRTLHFISNLRKAINEAGVGDRVRLVTCSYDGTSTIEPPRNPIPKNLIDALDMVVYYPITRCYKHDIDDEDCAVNKRFNDCLKGWTGKSPSMPVVIGEYYNVSKFEDLPILFTKRIVKDIPHYYNIGVRGVTYMHFPVVNMGLRSLTNILYANLSWNININCEELIDDYFSTYYEKYALEMKEAYELLEKAFEYCTQLRAWGDGSVLSQLIMWNGEKPKAPLVTDGHFTDHNSIINSCEKAVANLSKVLEIIKNIQLDLLKNKDTRKKDAEKAVNPIELAIRNKSSDMQERIGEDKRFVIYGLDTMELTLQVLYAYDKLYLGEEIPKENISKLMKLYDKMDSYYFPLGSSTFQKGLNCKSALSRTQLSNTVEKIIY